MNGAERAAEEALVRREVDLPGLRHALDPASLRTWAAAHGVGLPATARVDRLRCKPSTALRAAVDPGDGGDWWVLASASPEAWRKAGKDVRSGRRAGTVAVDERTRTLLLPAAGDRALRGGGAWVGGARTLAHNPARRRVLRSADGAHLVKVHADTTSAPRAVRAGTVLDRAGVATPAAQALDERTARTAWTPGEPLDAAAPGDAADVAALLGRLRDVPVVAARDLDLLAPLALREAVTRAVTGTLAVPLPGDLAARLRALHRWFDERSGDAALHPRHLAHGDLSPDQLLRTGPGPDGLVLLDLDRTGVAPDGWDAASWWAATTALQEERTRLPGAPPHPLLVVAAALLRCPEPFRRRRPEWLRRTASLVVLAEGQTR